MTTYTITEKQDINSVREGRKVEAKTLAAAKSNARKNQCFYGTTLTIESNGTLVAYTDGGKWINV